MKATVSDKGDKVTLTFAGKTKEIEVTDTWNDGRKLVSKNLNGVCRHRTGKKLYPVRMEFRLTGERYFLQTQYCCINRQATLNGWLEDCLSDEKSSELTLR